MKRKLQITVEMPDDAGIAALLAVAHDIKGMAAEWDIADPETNRVSIQFARGLATGIEVATAKHFFREDG